MKKIMYLFAAVCSLPAMEMKEFKKDHHEVAPQLLAAVVRVPAVSKMLAEQYVTCPIDISDVTFADDHIEILHLKNSETPFYTPSPNYFKCPLSSGQELTRIGITNLFNRSTSYHQDEDIKKFYLDGPNKNGIFVTCSMSQNNDNVRMVTDENMTSSASNRIGGQNNWSIALSENNVTAFSSVSTAAHCAFLELFKCNQQTNTRKILGFSKTEKTLTLDSKKLCTLMNHNFHVFTKMSFLSEDLLLGLDQSGQLYTIEHYFEEKKRPATFHHLAFNKKDFSSIKHYALDSYDKHLILMVDNNNDVRLGKITPNKLITKKIRSLQDIKNAIKRSGNAAKSLVRIRMAGNVCYFIFEGQNNNQQIFVTFSILPKQLSPKQKIDMIKANMSKKC